MQHEPEDRKASQRPKKGSRESILGQLPNDGDEWQNMSVQPATIIDPPALIGKVCW